MTRYGPTTLGLLVSVVLAISGAWADTAVDPLVDVVASKLRYVRAADLPESVRIRLEAELGTKGLLLRTDNQCTDGFFKNLCCQFDGVNGCQDADGNAIDGGPYYADEELAESDFILLNKYWAETVPEDYPFCDNYVVELTAAIKGPGNFLFFINDQDERGMGDVCDMAGEVVFFCVGSAFFVRDSMAGNSLPCAFAVETPANPYDRLVDFEGFDVSGTENCIP